MSRRLRPSSFSEPERAQIAFLAGRGRSASEIADAMGTTADAIYKFLSRAGIELFPRGPGSVAFVVKTQRAEYERLLANATEFDFEPADLASRLLSALLDEPVLLRNLLEDITD